MLRSKLKEPVRPWVWALLLAACAAAGAAPAALAGEPQVRQVAPGGRLPALVVRPQERAPAYTVDMVRDLAAAARRSPYVRPTLSADERLVIGRSPGWPADPVVPRHDIYGFELTDFQAEGEKTRIILASGNHNTEWTGTWGLHGALEFLLSDDERAAALRRVAVFYVYPMVNPDGRYTLRGRGSPQTQSLRASDHNRIWNTEGRFPTVDIQVAAMRRDTGGTAEYLVDFHSAGSTFFYTDQHLFEAPLARAWVERDSLARPRVSPGNPGMLRVWAMTEAGLGIREGYTPEFAGSLTSARASELGRNYMLGFYDVLVDGFGSEPAPGAAEPRELALPVGG